MPQAFGHHVVEGRDPDPPSVPANVPGSMPDSRPLGGPETILPPEMLDDVEGERHRLIREIQSLDAKVAELLPQVQTLRADRNLANEELLRRVRYLEMLVFLPPPGYDAGDD